MKFVKVIGVVTGLAAGVLWLVIGFRHALGQSMIGSPVPVILRTVIVGFAVIASVIVALRWSMIGGMLLVLEGIMPLLILFLIDVGFPVAYVVISAVTVVSGILFMAQKPVAASRK